LASAREAEKERLASKLENAAGRLVEGGESLLEPGEPLGGPDGLPGLPPPRDGSVRGEPRDGEDDRDWDRENRVAVLLVIDPRHTGIRMFGAATADPIICLGGDCYISEGDDAPASMLPRRRALGTGVTLGKRAGACRNSRICVFRSVALGAEEAPFQPIDLRILRHDRREEIRVRADPSCRVRQGRLTCETLAAARDYRAWIVPERVAERAGPEALRDALQTGIPAGGAMMFIRR
jgi:colicin import membrane protein